MNAAANAAEVAHGLPARRPPARQRSLRRHNLSLVLGELASAGRLSRAELARRVGLTKATVSSIAEALRSAGVIEELAAERTVAEGRGRPGNPLALSASGPVAVGVEIGVDFLSACVMDLAGETRAERSLASDNRRGTPEEHLDRVAALIAGLEQLARSQGCRPIGVGIAVPGVVAPDGVLRSAPNLPRWARRDLRAELGAKEVGNEANLAALGELWYGGRPHRRDFVLVSGEVGVGAGVVVDGRLYLGSGGAAGELGHVTVDASGPPCGCGSSGCLEQYVGQDALLRAAGVRSTRRLLEAARRGEGRVPAALEAAGEALGIACSALLNVVDVPAVVLGGRYAELAPYLRPRLEKELATRVVSHAWAPVELEVASLGAEAARCGAAGAVLHQLLADPAAYLPELLAA